MTESVLDSEEPEREDPEIRRAKTVLFLLVFGLIATFIVVLLVFFQPEGQLVVTRYPNGYPKTETLFKSLSGRRFEHGLHYAWHANGIQAEEGTHEVGQRSGVWRFWSEDGELDLQRSGVFEKGERVRPLEPDEK